MNVTDPAARIAVVSLWAEDVPPCAHFYRDVIGLKLAGHHGAWPHFDVGGAILVILEGRPHPATMAGPSRFPLLAISIEHFQSAVDRLAAASVPMPWGIEEDGTSRWVMFHDPAGNLIELVEGGFGGQAAD
jgi:catechol 2,3-dioxygenase-like lactoylglutathione lyase family enzyme